MECYAALGIMFTECGVHENRVLQSWISGNVMIVGHGCQTLNSIIALKQRPKFPQAGPSQRLSVVGTIR